MLSSCLIPQSIDAIGADAGGAHPPPSIEVENIGTPPVSSSRMICSRMLRVRSSLVFASRTTKSCPASTIFFTSASVM